MTAVPAHDVREAPFAFMFQPPLRMYKYPLSHLVELTSSRNTHSCIYYVPDNMQGVGKK